MQERREERQPELVASAGSNTPWYVRSDPPEKEGIRSEREIISASSRKAFNWKPEV